MATKALIIKFQTLVNVNKMSESDKEALLSSYGVESSKELTDRDLIDIINKLTSKESYEADQWRKRVMASIGAWLRSQNREDNANYIKAIACQATGYSNFNKIPINRLVAVYYEFIRKYEVENSVRNIKKGSKEYDETSFNRPPKTSGWETW